MAINATNVDFEDRFTIKTIEKRIVDGEDLTDEEKDFLGSKVDSYWREHPDVSYRFPRWKKYIAWVAGYQLYDYNKISRKLVEIPIKRKRRIVFNHLRPFVRTILSKLAADLPMSSVVPNSGENEDVEAARIGDKFIGGLSEKMGLVRQVNNGKSWLILANRACFRVLWNKDDWGISGHIPATEDFEDPITGEITQRPTGETEEIRQEGDICIESISPFNYRVDPLYTDQNRWRWFIYGEEKDAEEVEEEYELESGSLKESKENLFDEAFTLQLGVEQDVLVGSPGAEDEVTGRTVVFKEFWTPEIFVFVVDTQVVDYGINEYGEIPYYVAEAQLVPLGNYIRGFTYNESIIKDAIPVQREYNRQASIISVALDRASKMKIMTPFGSLPSKKLWSNDYGVFIDYNKAMGEPHQFRQDPLPTDIQTYATSLRGELENILSVHPASFGQLPERASHASGTLVNLLLEQDDTVLNPMLYVINEALSKAWSLALRIVQKEYDVGRMVKFVGEDGREAIEKFRGADLRGNTDVKIVSQTGLPRSRALRIEYLMKLREVGLLKDDKNTLEMMEFGRVEKIFEDQLLHEKVAYRENDLIERNPNIDPREVQKFIYPLERSDAHLKIHMRLRLSPRFNRLSENSKKLFDIHIELTHKKLMKEKQAQMEQMARFEQLKKAKSGEQPGVSPGAKPQ